MLEMDVEFLFSQNITNVVLQLDDFIFLKYLFWD